MRKSGFTLGETLMTILIIGIVAALTLPGVIRNYQKDMFATHLKKLTLDAENAAYLKTMHDAKPDFAHTSAFSSTHDCANCDNYMTIYMKAKVKNDIFASTYKSIDGTDVTDNFACESKSYKLPGNISACVTEKTVANTDYSPYYLVQIDLNGKSGPNLSGRDFFKFYIDENGIATAFEPGVTLEHILQAIDAVLTGSSNCSEVSIDANGDGYCNISDITYLIDLKLNYQPNKNICRQNSDGSNCFAILQQSGWKMEY